MFSKDVYSYLAQSAITARGLDPYSLGPAAALGVDDPLTRTIPTIWRDTPAPYGPLFLMLGRGITALTGSDVIQGVYAHRVLALCGVALIIWALPRLARRCDLDAGLVLWLGAANPLVLFHLVSGIHNEGLMIGLMLAGVELALRALDRAPHGFLRDPRFVLGAVVVSLGAPRSSCPRCWRWASSGWPRRGSAAGGCGTSRVVAAVLGRGRGGGLHRAGRRHRRWASAGRARWAPRTSSAAGCRWRRTWASSRGQVGILAGLGDHTDTVLTITRGLGGLAALLCARLLLLVLRGRLDPVTGLGGRAGRGRAARAGGAPLVPAVGGDPAGRHPRDAAAPARRRWRRRPLLAVMLPPDGSRLRLPVLPAAAGDPGRDRHSGVALLVVRRELRAGAVAGTRILLVDGEPAASASTPSPEHAHAGPRRSDGPAHTPGRRGSAVPDRPASSDLTIRLDFPTVSPLPADPIPVPRGAPWCPCAGWSSATAPSPRSTGWTWSSRPRPCSRCSARTAPGRPPPSRSARASPPPTRARSGVLGTDPAGAPDALRARIGVMPQGGGAYPGVRAGRDAAPGRRVLRATRSTRPG